MSQELFDAIRNGDREGVQRNLGSDPELREDGITPVLWCMYTGHPELVGLFGPELNFFEACATGNSPRAFGLLDQEPSLLRGHSADGHTGLGLAIYFKHPEIARELIQRGADVNQASKNAMGVAPIHAAAAAGDAEMVQLLLQSGADKDAKQASGHTALDSAKMSGREDLIALLS